MPTDAYGSGIIYIFLRFIEFGAKYIELLWSALQKIPGLLLLIAVVLFCSRCVGSPADLAAAPGGQILVVTSAGTVTGAAAAVR